IDVLANDSDVENTALTAVIVDGPLHGTLTLNADGSFNYQPNANYNGSDSFTYRASDGSAQSAIATVSITVTAVNDAPTAGNDSATTVQGSPVVIGVLANDSDVENSTLTVEVVSNPANGQVVVNANGTITYTPNTSY